MTKRIVWITVSILLIVAALGGWRCYHWVYDPNTGKGTSNLIYVYAGDCYEDVYQALATQGILIRPRSFDWVASRMHFDDHSIKEGRYLIPVGISNYDLIHKLRLGQQDPVDLVINTAPTLNDLAAILDRQLAMDSSAFIAYTQDTYIPRSAYTPETILSLFIPNTYEVWWNVSPAKLLARMESEHDRFWNADRRAKAAQLSMTPTEVYTLASIVESETQVSDERATIAGVYLNRLRLHIPLQADPTIRFALKDKTVHRILLKHLEIDSPYNTYRNSGLPPGPITMPTIQSIDAVLNAEDNDYLFFCARPGYDGRHDFARTLSAHLANARHYQKWLDQQGIR